MADRGTNSTSSSNPDGSLNAFMQMGHGWGARRMDQKIRVKIVTTKENFKMHVVTLHNTIGCICR